MSPRPALVHRTYSRRPTPIDMLCARADGQRLTRDVIAASRRAARFAWMTFAAWLAAAYSGLALLIHIATVAIAAVRCRTPARPLDPPQDAPGVTLVRPVCGL